MSSINTKTLNAIKGKFIVFDGPDGSGKGTQINKFKQFLNINDIEHMMVREPGGTHISEEIRRILLDPKNENMSTYCEMLLFMASRAQLIHEKIKPALDSGHTVIADRFVTSTIAYQGVAGDMQIEDIFEVSRVVVNECKPDLTIILDVDETTSRNRLNPLALDRIEQKKTEYHQKVRNGYLAQAMLDPNRFLIVDSSKTPDEVFDSLLEGLTNHVGFGNPQSPSPSDRTQYRTV